MSLLRATCTTWQVMSARAPIIPSCVSSSSLRHLLQDCFKSNPRERPAAKDVVDKLQGIMWSCGLLKSDVSSAGSLCCPQPIVCLQSL